MERKVEFTLPPFVTTSDTHEVCVRTAYGDYLSLVLKPDGSVAGSWSHLCYRPKLGIIRERKPATPAAEGWVDPIYFSADAVEVLDRELRYATEPFFRHIILATEGHTYPESHPFYGRIRVKGEPASLWAQGSSYLSLSDLLRMQSQNPMQFSNGLRNLRHLDRQMLPGFYRVLAWLRDYVAL